MGFYATLFSTKRGNASEAGGLIVGRVCPTDPGENGKSSPKEGTVGLV